MPPHVHEILISLVQWSLSTVEKKGSGVLLSFAFCVLINDFVDILDNNPKSLNLASLKFMIGSSALVDHAIVRHWGHQNF